MIAAKHQMVRIPSGEHCPAGPFVLAATVSAVDQHETVLLSNVLSDAGWPRGFFLMHTLSRSGNRVQLSAL